MKSVLLSILLLLTSQLALASTTINIPIPAGGVVTPHGDISITAKSFIMPDVRYIVTCNVTAQDNVAAYIYIQNRNAHITVNGKSMPSATGTVQTILKAGENTVTFAEIIDPAVGDHDITTTFGMKDIDSTLSFTITACLADPILSDQ